MKSDHRKHCQHAAVGATAAEHQYENHQFGLEQPQFVAVQEDVIERMSAVRVEYATCWLKYMEIMMVILNL